MKKKKKIIILGAGIAGLSASYHLSKRGLENTIIEKNKKPGGLLDNIKIKGFTFDHFIHISLAKDNTVKNFFKKSAVSFVHNPKPNNYYYGKWLTHSPQNHLYPLGFIEKMKIIISFILRNKIKIEHKTNYEDWLKTTYGNYFAEKFPMEYTKKYWTVNAKQMSSRWVSFRMNKPNLKDLFLGAFFPLYKNTYYANNLRYPKKGGFKSYLSILLKNDNILLNQNIIEIDTTNKIIKLRSGKKINYDILVSSIPLNTLCKLIKTIPKDILKTSKKLKYTSGIIVCLGFKKKIKSEMWFYVYDKNIKFARVHSPSLKSKFNAPKGCSSLQAEIYLKNNIHVDEEYLKDIEQKTIESLKKMKIFEESDLILRYSKYIKFANVLFDKKIYSNRDKVKDFLKSKNIKLIGRFGEWDYLWSDQAFISGKKIAEEIL